MLLQLVIKYLPIPHFHTIFFVKTLNLPLTMAGALMCLVVIHFCTPKSLCEFRASVSASTTHNKMLILETL